MTKYRKSLYGSLYKLEKGVPYLYSPVKDEWLEDESAADAFYEGEGTYAITEAEAMQEIEEQKKNK